MHIKWICDVGIDENIKLNVEVYLMLLSFFFQAEDGIRDRFT